MKTLVEQRSHDMQRALIELLDDYHLRSALQGDRGRRNIGRYWGEVVTHGHLDRATRVLVIRGKGDGRRDGGGVEDYHPAGRNPLVNGFLFFGLTERRHE